MPDAKLRKVGLLVVHIIIDVVFVVDEVDIVDGVAWHSPAIKAIHIVAQGNDDVEKNDVDNVEVVPCPQDSSERRSARRSGDKQRAPAAVSRITMHSAGNVPSYSQADNSAEKDEHDGEAELARRVAMSHGISVWGRGPSWLHGGS